MRGTALIAAAFALTPIGISAQQNQDHAEERFNAQAAWDEFEQVLRGYYGYIERDDIDVEAQMDRSRALALEAESATAIRTILHQTALTFADPHLIVGPFEDGDYAIIMTAADLSAHFVDRIARIEDVRRGSPAFEAGLRPGDAVLSIDGVPSRQAAQLPFGDVLPDPTPAQLDYGLTLAINGKREGERVLKVQGAGRDMRSVTLQSTRNYARELSERAPVSLSYMGDDKDIALVTILNSLGDNDTIEAFDEVMTKARNARALVLDMRDTPSGGNTEVARSIIGHFVTETMPYQMHRIPSLEREFSVPRQFVEYVYPRQPYFEGRVIVLHGKWTGSMGEGIVIGMDAATDAVTIGSDMGDLLGGLRNWDLQKSGARLDLGVETLFHVDGTPREHYMADYPLMPASTANDGSDPALAKALKLIHGFDYANQSR